jgi:hypothetical protein
MCREVLVKSHIRGTRENRLRGLMHAGEAHDSSIFATHQALPCHRIARRHSLQRSIAKRMAIHEAVTARR